MSSNVRVFYEFEVKNNNKSDLKLSSPSFGSIFWLLGVPIGSLSQSLGSLLVLETVLFPSRVKMASAQVSISKQSYIYIWVLWWGEKVLVYM